MPCSKKHTAQTGLATVLRRCASVESYCSRWHCALCTIGNTAREGALAPPSCLARAEDPTVVSAGMLSFLLVRWSCHRLDCNCMVLNCSFSKEPRQLLRLPMALELICIFVAHQPRSSSNSRAQSREFKITDRCIKCPQHQLTMSPACSGARSLQCKCEDQRGPHRPNGRWRRKRGLVQCSIILFSCAFLF